MRASIGLFLFLIQILSPSGAQANPGEAYGLGARTAALAGAGAAWGNDGFAAYHNPASLSLIAPERRLHFSTGIRYMLPRFKDITGVVVENNFSSDKTPARSGDVVNDYKATFGQELGLSYLIAPDWFKLALGVTAFVPIEHTAFMDTGETYIPEYVLYRARHQRPVLDLGLGAKFGAFSAGVGLHGAFGLNSSGTVFIQTSTGKPSSMRFSSSVKPKLVPYFGFLYLHNPEEGIGNSGSHAFGLVVRLPAASDNTMTLNSGARLLGNLSAFDFRFQASSALFYDPGTIELGWSWQHSSLMRSYAQLEYQFWRLYKAPSLEISQTQITSCEGDPTTCGVAISPGTNPSLALRNIPVARFGEEIDFSSWTLRVGYGFRPSIFKDVPNGAGNYLDPSKHMFTAGAGWKFSRILSAQVPCSVDINLAYNVLMTQSISKTAGNEAGDAADSKIGAPGYEAGGKEYGGGISLSLAL